MTILGIHQGHDSSAAIVRDGKIIADVQEERFSRVKHSANAPLESIAFCLKQAGIKNINELDYISSTWEACPYELRVLFNLKEPTSLKRDVIKAGKLLLGTLKNDMKLKLPIYYPDYSLTDTGKFVDNNHHLAHAASAYFTRKNNEKCLVFTIDGAGDNICTAIWQAEGNKIELLKSYYKEASIGWAYSTVTEGLHWIHGDGEGKTMGLAPYGDYNKCKHVLDKYFPNLKMRTW